VKGGCLGGGGQDFFFLSSATKKEIRFSLLHKEVRRRETHQKLDLRVGNTRPGTTDLESRRCWRRRHTLFKGTDIRCNRRKQVRLHGSRTASAKTMRRKRDSQEASQESEDRGASGCRPGGRGNSGALNDAARGDLSTRLKKGSSWAGGGAGQKSGEPRGP